MPEVAFGASDAPIPALAASGGPGAGPRRWPSGLERPELALAPASSPPRSLKVAFREIQRRNLGLAMCGMAMLMPLKGAFTHPRPEGRLQGMRAGTRTRTADHARSTGASSAHAPEPPGKRPRRMNSELANRVTPPATLIPGRFCCSIQQLWSRPHGKRIVQPPKALEAIGCRGS